MQPDITFATLGTPASINQTTLLLESLRRFGGRFSTCPAIVLCPDHRDSLSEEANKALTGLNAQPVPFEMPETLHDFPLAAVPYAAAAAESQAESSIMVWILYDGLILNPPEPFALPDDVDFAYRPVHHTLVGSIYDQPLDTFWSAVYRHCGVDENALFPMQTCVRDNTLRPYFNAGLAVVRPELGLLNIWVNQFERLAHHPDFEALYTGNRLYAVFIHQAILSAVVPKQLGRERLLELPDTINYPIHLHSDHPPEHRPEKINDLLTCRYEEFEILQKALGEIPVDETYKSWLFERLPEA